MKIKYLKRSLLFVALSVLTFTMCKTSDLRTSELKKTGITPESTAKAKAILQEALTTMRYDAWAKHPTYEVVGSDFWHKQMGMNLSPWRGDNGAKLRLSYATNTFDSKAEWLEGKTKGEILGVQSWQLYRQMTNGKVEKLGADRQLNFILPTMHYFIELLPRLANAPIVAYMGEETLKNGVCDRIFITWNTPEPNKNDQYILYINRQNKRVERTTYTIRDNFMWTPKNFYGTAVYSDYRQVDSVWIPFKMDVYPFAQTDKMKVHTFTINDFRFDAFPIDTLYPFADLSKLGDFKN
jgi:hypothetical protein